jgi:DNA-binding MarR family transcriptional regulator
MGREANLRAVDAALTRIGRVANSRRAAARRARRSGVTLAPTAVATLAAVYRLGPARQSAIAEHLELEPSRVSREVRTLVDGGLVRQEDDPDDGRAVLLVATAAGREAFERYRRAADEILAESLQDWDERDLAALASLLTRLAGSLDERRTTTAATPTPTPGAATDRSR